MFSRYVDVLSTQLKGMLVTGRQGAMPTADEGLNQLVTQIEEMQAKSGTIYMIGNGASATMASHMALDATKNGKLKVQAFNDVASLTALGNDLGYDEVFAFPLSRYASSGDMLLTISSSGNSPSIIRAIETARELGMKVITLSGMKPDNRSRALGDLNFYIPATTYGMVECAHQVLMHYWLDLYITHHVKDAPSSVCLPEE